MSMAMTDIYWVAGFLEGEGSFSICGDNIRVQATQVELDPLEKLTNFFGGKTYAKKITGYGKKPVNSWFIGGGSAAGVMMMIYKLMSVRRKGQIMKCLKYWRSKGSRFGERHYGVTVSDKDVMEAMRRVQGGESLVKVSKEIGVSHSSLSMWMNGVHRPSLIRELSGGHPTRRFRTFGELHYNVLVSDEDALAAMRKVQAGSSMYSVAKDLGLNPNTVSYWMRGLKRPYLLAQLQQEDHSVKEVSDGRSY